jgi:hypothetical protein
VSIAFLKSLYKGAPVRITGEYRIEGSVISDDRFGNFYKTLVIDDSISGGIEIRLDLEDIIPKYYFHSRVAVRCNGLWLGSYGGTLQLGAEPFGEYETQYIPGNVINQHLYRDITFYREVLPHKLKFSELSARYISTFVGFENVRFIDEESGMCWSEADADTDRHLVDEAGDTLIVRTSRFARFGYVSLPKKSGFIEGVLGYFNGTYQLTVCDNRRFYPYSE